jgi:allantoate deiminase
MARVREWMEAAGLATRSDTLGNLVGRREAAAGGVPPLDAAGGASAQTGHGAGAGGAGASTAHGGAGAPAGHSDGAGGSAPGTIVIGSHLDSVADAGRYDGILGVLVGLEVAEAVGDLPVALEVVAFADEEGLRFQSTYLGSRAYVGRLEAAELAALRDAGGVTLGEAVGAGAPGPALLPADIRAYFEVHIEQGPVLEAGGLPLGVVTAIAGQNRFNLTFTGRAGHAGTTPMQLRGDALGAAAEFVLAAERAAREEPGLVATVGELGIPHGACNVIPGRVEGTLDIRHQDDATLARAIAALRAEADAICARRGIDIEWEPIAADPATPCSPALVARLREAVAATGAEPYELPSGAGHDAVTMAGVTDVAMLFVRCAGGISHHPDESVEEADVALAVAAAVRFVRGLAEEQARARPATEEIAR